PTIPTDTTKENPRPKRRGFSLLIARKDKQVPVRPVLMDGDFLSGFRIWVRRSARYPACGIPGCLRKTALRKCAPDNLSVCGAVPGQGVLPDCWRRLQKGRSAFRQNEDGDSCFPGILSSVPG